jgi:D-alanine--poly(phosphoribitol) ligase subunit 2
MSGLNAAIDKLSLIFRNDMNIEISGPDQDLIEEGLLDSLSLVEMLVLLEQKFGIEMSISDIDFDSFRSVRNIAQFVAGKTAERAPAGVARVTEPEPA